MQGTEKEMEAVTVMMAATTNEASSSPTSPAAWKLYDNPHYSSRHHQIKHYHRSYTCISASSSRTAAGSTRSSTHARDLASFGRAMGGGEGVNLSDLDNALAEIKELRAELEFERRMRRKVEALNKALSRELAEERRLREAAEGTCRRLAEEIGGMRAEAERAMKEVEDERRMLRMAEAMREERVQMKLSEARFLMEEKIKEMMPPDNCKESPSQPQPPSADRSPAAARKEVENPHIKRGIKGMEFPRAVRVRSSAMGSSPGSREGRTSSTAHQLGSNLECQRAQLRVLMRHRSPVGSGMMGAAENLVM